VKAQAQARSYRFPGTVVRVTPWQGRTDTAAIAVSGTDPPRAADLERLLDRLRAAGYRAVVTNAVTVCTAAVLADAGFATRGRLELLERPLDAAPPPSGTTRRATRADRRAVVAVDAAAFAPDWRFDEVALREAADATPRARMLVAPREGSLQAYGLFGLDRVTGYVQRLAVAPAAQGRGLARALLDDGLRWLARRGAARVLVNTQPDNRRALELYRHAGFGPRPSGLFVLGRTL
jgi:ribosomal protein S18 acetylase RimI-like enzyme